MTATRPLVPPSTVTTLPPVAQILAVVELHSDFCRLRLTAPGTSGPASRRLPAVFEIGLELPAPFPGVPPALRAASPLAVRLEVTAQQVTGAWGFFRRAGGAERRPVSAVFACMAVSHGVHGTVTARSPR
jgi:hypothetical protein